MNRRDLLLGGSMLLAAGSAAALTPRKRLVLLGDQQLDDIIPKTIGDWQFTKSDAIVLPKTAGSLSDRLYSQTVSRLYQSPDHDPMMLVIAYGAIQNDLLQLHRPEVCYTAVGFTITESQRGVVTLAPDVHLPVRRLTAINEQRIEPVFYWTRIGDDLPTSGNEQRWVKLRQQMRGYLSDGILVRISTIGDASDQTFEQMSEFARELVLAIRPSERAVLIGRPMSAAMNAA